MSTSDDLRGIFNAARPLVEQWLGLADEFAALRDTARAKGLDWGQIKALAKATVLDHEDGGERVKKLIEKADLSLAYSDMLGLATNMNKKNFSDGPTADQHPDHRPEPESEVTPATADASPLRQGGNEPAGADGFEVPTFLKRPFVDKSLAPAGSG